MKKIPLTQSLFAIVDNDTYEKVSKYKWCAKKHGNTYYAVRGYRVEGGNFRVERMHRFILDSKPGEIIDHINGNGFDNRLCNLRICTQSENTKNQSLKKNSSSGYKGVSQMGANRWRAYIFSDGRQIALGGFPTKEDAALAYNKAAILHFGQFAKLNVVNYAKE